MQLPCLGEQIGYVVVQEVEKRLALLAFQESEVGFF
jgi:hypothetical protein